MHQVDSGVVTNSSGHKVGSLALAKMIDQLVDKRSVSIFRQLWFRCKYVLYIFIIYQKTILLIICVYLAVLVCHYESSTFHTTLSFLRLRTFAARSALEISEALPKLRSQGASEFVIDLRGNGGISKKVFEDLMVGFMIWYLMWVDRIFLVNVSHAL